MIIFQVQIVENQGAPVAFVVKNLPSKSTVREQNVALKFRRSIRRLSVSSGAFKVQIVEPCELIRK